MWISKKKWKKLSDENSALKQRVKDMEHLSMVVEHANREGKRNVYVVDGNYCLVGNNYYGYLVQSINMANEELKIAKEEADTYKRISADELQKRLELADRVRELEGK